MPNELAINENQDILYSGFVLSSTGLKAIGEPSFEEWEKAGEFIRKAEGAVHFWVGDWLNYGEGHYGETYTQAIDATGWDYQTVANDKWISKSIEFSLRGENLGISHAKEIASLPEEEKRYWAGKINEEKITVKELKDGIKKRKFSEFSTPEIPEGKYNVIYADPPWEYGDKLIDTYGAAEHHYPTMPLEDICLVKVPSDENAVLFLWTTSPLLEDSFKVINSWGFTYKTSFIWDKVKHNYGHYNSVRHEILLVCTKGSMLPEVGTLYDSVVVEERNNTHSSKPEKFYEIIETLYPSGKYLELFARNKRDNWTSWGNEV